MGLKGLEKYKKEMAVIGILILLVIVFLAPILAFDKLSYWGVRDWGLFQVGREVSREAAVSGQVPLWDPYSCGGRPFLENPQHPMFSPSTILLILFGTMPGIKLSILLYFCIGAAGMYILMRHLKAGTVGSILAALIFVFSSYFYLYLVEGHYWNMVWLLLPFIFYFFIKSLENPKYSILAAGLLVVMLFEGLSMGFVLTFIFLGIYAIFKSIEIKKIRPLVIVAIIALIVMLLGAVKMIPQISYVADNPRNVGQSDTVAYDLQVFYNALLNREQGAYSHNFPGQQNMAWAEYGMYVGWIAVLLFIIGICIYYKREWPLLATLLIFIIFAFGVNSPINLWNALLSLPIFSSMKQAPRVKAYILLCIAIFAGLALSKIERSNKVKYGNKTLNGIGKWIAIVLVIIILADLFMVSRYHLNEAFIIPPQEIQRSSEFYNVEAAQVPNPYTVNQVIPQHYESSAGQKPYINLLAGLGTKNCYETIYNKRGGEAKVIWNGTIMNYQENQNYRGEVYFESDVAAGKLLENAINKAHIENMDFQGFVISIDSIAGADMMILAQNYEKGWQVEGSVDNVVYERDGLIGVKIDSSTKQIALTYTPKMYVFCLWLSIFSTIGFIFLLIRWEKLKFTKKIDEVFHNI